MAGVEHPEWHWVSVGRVATGVVKRGDPDTEEQGPRETQTHSGRQMAVGATGFGKCPCTKHCPCSTC